MKRHSLAPEARALEEAFFERENTKLLEKLREQAEHEERRAALREVVMNADDDLLDHLLELGIGPETALAVMLVPLAASVASCTPRPTMTLQRKTTTAIATAAMKKKTSCLLFNWIS